MSNKKIYDDRPFINTEVTNKVLLGGEDSNEPDFDMMYKKHMGKKTSLPDNNNIGSDDPDDYKVAILDQCGKKSCKNTKGVVHFREARKPLSEHPLNTTFNEDASEVLSKGLMLGGTAIVAKGIHDALGGPYKPMFTGATLVGAGVLIYKLTDQDIKKFYRNYVSRLEGNYDNLISYADYAQFVKKYHFKYEEDYYFLNDVLAGKEDPIDMNKFMELNRYNLGGKHVL